MSIRKRAEQTQHSVRDDAPRNLSSTSFTSSSRMMGVIVAALAAFAMMVLFPEGGLLACPACADNLAAADAERANGFAASILGLLSLPLALVGGVGLFVVRAHRRKNGMLLLLAAVAVGFAGCGGSEEKGGDAAAAKGIPADMSKAVQVSGTITFEGTPPSPEVFDVSSDGYCGLHHAGGVVHSEDVIVTDGKLADVFIYVSKGLEGYSFPTPTTPAVLDQQGCRYQPHVLGMMAGQKLEIRNSDSTLHNVHAITKKNKSFNIPQDFKETDQKIFENEEVMIPVVCDVHGWMKSWVGVLPHPAFAVSAKDGSWSFKVPAGTYTVTAWHERYGRQEAQITAKEGEPVSLNFTFK